MKEITIQIPEETYRELKSALAVKHIACVGYGIIDAFVGAMITRIEKGQTAWVARKKGEGA